MDRSVYFASLIAFSVDASCDRSSPLAAHSRKRPHTFTVANGQFQLDGHPYQILSGEMHYPACRVPTGATVSARPAPWA